MGQRIRFNPWKHHLQWVKKQIECILSRNDGEITNALIHKIKAMNSNQVDIYTGTLSPEELTGCIDARLLQMNIVNREDFRFWLNESEYKLLRLSDGSDWVLRLGMEDEHYIHIHPARNSVNVVRIHGNSWKTALVLKLLRMDPEHIDLDFYNLVRRKYLSLSPVKSLIKNDRLWRTLRLLWKERLEV